MSEDRQLAKVKLFRVLKVVFYCMSLPLFTLLVLFSSMRFVNNDPFQGTYEFTSKLGFFMSYEKLLTSPALYGVYIAVAIWLFIFIVHLILSKTVKNRRTRMVVVVAVLLVTMLGSMLIMDTVFEAKISEISASAPAGVEVKDYKTQLSYYRAISSNNKGSSMTTQLITKVSDLQRVYNVNLTSGNLSGAAHNYANKPVTYANIISDSGKTGVDISFKYDEDKQQYVLDYDPADGKNYFKADGDINYVEENQIVKLKPVLEKDDDGNDVNVLYINGEKYSHYYCVSRWEFAYQQSTHAWYAKEMMSEKRDGDFGVSFYNQNDLLSDGCVPGLDTICRILENYYTAKEAIENGTEKTSSQFFRDAYPEIYRDALERRDAYYKGEIPDADGNLCDPWTRALYKQEVRMTERFSLTRGELDELLAKVGGLLGDNSLFNYLFVSLDDLIDDSGLGSLIGGSFVSGLFSSLFSQLNNGMSVGAILDLIKGFGVNIDLDSIMPTVYDILLELCDKKDSWETEINDLFIVASYKHPNAFSGGEVVDHLYLAIVADDGTYDEDPETGKKTWNLGGKDRILLDIDFDDALLDEDLGEYAFDFDRLSNFLNKGLNNLLDKFGLNVNDGIVGTILGLFLKNMEVDGVVYKGLDISGIKVPIINTQTGKIDLDIIGIVEGLLQNWYEYRSPVFKPVWEFYLDPDETRESWIEAATYYRMYDKAYYTGYTQASIINSACIGSKYGTGFYPTSMGLNSLAAVQQFMSDMSYQPIYFPLFALRDTIASFSALTILFYFLCFVAAQKQEDYATGKLVAKPKREKKSKKANAAQDDATAQDTEAVQDDLGEEEYQAEAYDEYPPGGFDGYQAEAQSADAGYTEPPVDQNNDKEVR